MREILFRGKTKQGKWVQGDLSQHKTGKKFIKCGSALQSFEVIPKSVGQFSGLTDKNGTKIFESDIVKITFPNGIIKTDVVKFANGGFLPYIIQYDTFFWGGNDSEVIGNIHDNPELLEVKE